MNQAVNQLKSIEAQIAELQAQKEAVMVQEGLTAVPRTVDDYPTVAAFWNDQFTHREIYNPRQRFEQTVKDTTRSSWSNTWEEDIQNALEALKVNRPDLCDRETFLSKMPYAKVVTLADIRIDTSIQRKLYLEAIIKFINGYTPEYVMPIKVYIDENGDYQCWDGQHTAILQMLVGFFLVGLRPEDFNITVIVTPNADKEVMRNAFINENGAGKTEVNAKDIQEQHLYGTILDKSTNPEWLVTLEKHKHFVQNDLFVSDNRYSNTQEPGSFPRPAEFMKYSIPVIKDFSNFCKSFDNSLGVYEGMFSRMMLDYFDACHREEMDIDKTYIQKLASAIRNAGTTPSDVTYEIKQYVRKSQESHFLAEAKQMSYTPSYITNDGRVNRNTTNPTDKKCDAYLREVLKNKYDINVPSYYTTWTINEEHMF